jgi:hypothetical protein
MVLYQSENATFKGLARKPDRCEQTLSRDGEKVMRRIAWLGVLALAVAGCGGGPKLVPVKGRVVYANGQPVTAASVSFTPDAATGNNAILATGLLAEDGTFTLRTYPHGDGAMIGSYRVTVALGFGATRKLAKYTRLKDTPLRIDVPAEGRTGLVLTLE